MKSKSIEQLEKVHWKEETDFPTDLIKRCFQYRKIPINELSVDQIRTLLSQKIGVKYLIELAMDKLAEDIMIEADLYKGDLLETVSKITLQDWNSNQKQYEKLKELISANTEIIKEEFGEKDFRKLIERLK